MKSDPNTNGVLFHVVIKQKNPPMVIREKVVDALNGRVCLFIYLCLVCAILSLPSDFSTRMPFNPPFVSVNVICVQTVLQLGVVYITWVRIGRRWVLLLVIVFTAWCLVILDMCVFVSQNQNEMMRLCLSP